MISDEELREVEDFAREAIIAHQCPLSSALVQWNFRLIAEIRRLREQLKPDCVNGCIFKLARKIAEEGK